MWVQGREEETISQESAHQTGQSWNPACTLPEPTIRLSCPHRVADGEGRKLWRTTNAFSTQLTFVYVAHVVTADAAGACVTSVCKVRWHELQLQLQHQQHKLQLLVFASCSWQLSLSAAKEGNFLPAASTKLFACDCNENWHLHVAMLGNRQHVLPGEEEPRKEFPLPPHSIMQSMACTACKSFVSYLPV